MRLASLNYWTGLVDIFWKQSLDEHLQLIILCSQYVGCHNKHNESIMESGSYDLVLKYLEIIPSEH